VVVIFDAPQEEVFVIATTS